MSVRMAIVKLSGVVAGGALIGGGAVHVAEKPATTKPEYVKHAKAPVHKEAKAPLRERAKRVVKTATCKIEHNCPAKQELAVVPLPAPAWPTPAPAPGYDDMGGPHNSQYYRSMGPNGVVVVDRTRRHPAPQPTPVPAPPMLVLFGLAAATLFARRQVMAKPA